MEIVIGIIGLVVGLVIGILVARAQKSALEIKADALSDEVARLKEEIALQKSELNGLSTDKQELATKCEVLATQKDNVEAKAREEAEKHIKDIAAQEEVFAKQMASVKEDNEQKCKDLQERHDREISILNDSHQKLLQAKETEHKAVLAAQEKRHNEAVQSMKQTFAETIEHLKANLKAATEDMLKTRQAEFTYINKQNMQSIVDPLNETIAKMKQAMDGYSKEQNEFSGSMKTSIQTIIQQTETARQSAIELTTALKHDTKMQGDYGEAILDEILSKQGFTEGIHYELQYVMKDEAGKELKGDDGKGLRPDVLFHIDTVRDVIIDSKVNLTDFINFANAETADERKMYLERHVKSIESQVKLLSQKNYFKYHKKTNARMDYVIMFVPISAAWWEALRYKPSLWREAMDSNVYIADEQTLFAALRIIKLTWTQIAQVKSQKEIFDLVNQMIDRVGQFMKSYKTIGEAIGKAQDAYEKGYEKLSPGGQSILTTTNNLLKLGGRDSKTNPVSKFIDVDEVAQLPAPQIDNIN